VGPNAADPSYTDQGRDLILDWLASALPAPYEEGGDPCDDDACEADVEGASFNDAWKTFATWE
jgi:hypothetical protein